MNGHDLLPTDLDRIAAVVAEQGFDAIDPALVDAVVDRAVARGASATFVHVVTTDAEPPVARLRAFGRIVQAAAKPAPTRTPVHAAA